jgi:hypothetical protein
VVVRFHGTVRDGVFADVNTESRPVRNVHSATDRSQLADEELAEVFGYAFHAKLSPRGAALAPSVDALVSLDFDQEYVSPD